MFKQGQNFISSVTQYFSKYFWNEAVNLQHMLSLYIHKIPSGSTKLETFVKHHNRL